MSKYMLFDNGRNEVSYVDDKVKLLLALVILLQPESKDFHRFRRSQGDIYPIHNLSK